MIILAIDLHLGEAVKLYQGDYTRKTVYSKNPVEIAKKAEEIGIKYLHIVDLDGAKTGNAANIEVIRQIRENVNIPIQFGGGIRSEGTVAFYLEKLKIDRVVLGTVAIANPDFVRQMIEKYGAERIVVGVDVFDDNVAVDGWLRDSGVNYLEFIERLKKIGVQYILATDISKQGTMNSLNWEMYEKITGMNVIAAGGVSCNEDIEKALKYYGIIVGKAYYEGKVDLESFLTK